MTIWVWGYVLLSNLILARLDLQIFYLQFWPPVFLQCLSFESLKKGPIGCSLIKRMTALLKYFNSAQSNPILLHKRVFVSEWAWDTVFTYNILGVNQFSSFHTFKSVPTPKSNPKIRCIYNSIFSSCHSRNVNPAFWQTDSKLYLIMYFLFGCETLKFLFAYMS